MVDITFGTVVHDKTTNQKSFISQINIEEGHVISTFSQREILKTPTYLTVQKSDKEHILLHPEALQYINHSCNPNVFFDVDNFEIIALKNIKIGEEITFFYPSTEWEMAQPFTCNCKSEFCLGKINGTFDLSLETILKYRASKYIQEKIHIKYN